MTDAASDILAHAIEWARAGGQLARRRFRSAVGSLKKDRTIVTDADHAVQDLIVDAVARHYPDHAVITEETLGRPDRHASFSAAEWCWVIDPIDGTRNYWRGIACFAVSIGVLRHGEPAAGAVYAVMTDQMYSAAAGAGAWRDGTRLRAIDEPPSGDTLIGSPSGRGDGMPPPTHDWFDRMTLRNVGATALHLAMVAEGAMDAAYCLGCKLWDIAAGTLLVTEAGGVVTDMNGRPCFPPTANQATAPACTPYLAAGPRLHAYLLSSWRAFNASA